MQHATHELRLLEDTLPSGATWLLPEDGVNRVLYTAHGGFSVGGVTFGDDQAWHGRGGAEVVAGPHGAAIWRFELVLPGSPAVTPPQGSSLAKLSCPVALPAAELLMRGDSVAFPPGGCAFTHTHQGPGIRCLIEGGIRIDSEGHSTSHAPGGAWFEAGPDPVFAQAAHRASRFIRVMILPAALLGKSSIHYVNEADRAKPKSQQYKGYVDALIDV
jgi:hypothetical protein